MDPTAPLDPCILESHVAGARRLAQALLHDRDSADDAVQDAFVVALTKPPRPGWDFAAWLRGVIRNKAREQRRALARRAPSLGDHDPAGPTLEPGINERMDVQRRLFAAVLALPEAYREVVWLRHFEDLPPRTIAARLAIPVETVRTRHRRALGLLRDALGGATGPEAGRWRLALLPLASPGGAGGTGLLGNGGLLMALGTKSIMGLGAAAVLAAALLLWSQAGAQRMARPSRTESTDTASTAAPTLEGLAAPAKAPVSTAEAPAVTPSWIVVGRVLDEDNTPLAEAEILWGRPATLDVADMVLLARSGVDGRFQVSLPLESSHVRLVARALGRLPAPGLAWRGHSENVEFRLLRLRDLFLRVLDADTGVPLEGVRCEALLERAGQQASLRATTGPDGRVTLPDPEPASSDQPVRVQFAKDGYAPLVELSRALLKGRGGSLDRPLDVYLRRGAGLRLRVVDEAGRPVGGVEVEAWTGPGGRLWLQRPASEGGLEGAGGADKAPLGRATSDERGLVTLGVPDVQAPWWALATHGHEIGFAWHSFAKDREVQWDLILRPTHEVTGTVRSEEGSPLSGAWVRFQWQDVLFPGSSAQGGTPAVLPAALEDRSFAVTDAEGRFRFAAVPIRADGAEQWIYANHADALGQARLVAPPEGQGPLVLDVIVKSVGARVRVKVLDAESGLPIAGAAVTWDRMVPTTPTDADGVAVRARHPSGSMTISVRAPGYAPYRGDRPPAGEAVEVRLQRARTLEGRVLDTEGTPVSAYVDIFVPEVAALPDEERAKRQVHGVGWLARGESGALGVFRVADLPPGPLYLRAWVMRSESKGHRFPKVEHLLEEGELCELRLPADELGQESEQEVTGAVFTQQGRRLTRYRIALEGEGRYTQPLQTGWEFRFAGIPPGSYALTASDEGGTQRGRLPIVLRAGEDLQGLRVILGDTATLVAKLIPPVDAPPADLKGIRVVLVREGRSWGEGPGSIMTDANGAFRVESLEPGLYLVTLRAPAGGRPAWQVRDGRLELGAGSSSRDLPVVVVGRLVLVFQDERFDDNPEVQMERLYEPGVQASLGTAVRVRSAASGELKAMGLFRGRHAREWALLPGNYDLEVESKTLGAFRSSFRVLPGADTEVTVVLSE